MTLIWISLLIASLLIASFIGGFFAAKRISEHHNHTELDDFDDFLDHPNLADPYQAPEFTTAAVKELKHAYVVIANINEREVALKQFPKDDNPQLAKINAEELADEIMND